MSRHQGVVAERNSYRTAAELTVGDRTYRYHRITDLTPADLPTTLRIVLLENLLRHQDGNRVDTAQIDGLLRWGVRRGQFLPELPAAPVPGRLQVFEADAGRGQFR